MDLLPQTTISTERRIAASVAVVSALADALLDGRGCSEAELVQVARPFVADTPAATTLLRDMVGLRMLRRESLADRFLYTLAPDVFGQLVQEGAVVVARRLDRAAA